jgi:hypothetical protein
MFFRDFGYFCGLVGMKYFVYSFFLPWKSIKEAMENKNILWPILVSILPSILVFFFTPYKVALLSLVKALFLLIFGGTFVFLLAYLFNGKNLRGKFVGVLSGFSTLFVPILIFSVMGSFFVQPQYVKIILPYAHIIGAYATLDAVLLFFFFIRNSFNSNLIGTLFFCVLVFSFFVGLANIVYPVFDSLLS